jgi:hypothetical protein
MEKLYIQDGDVRREYNEAEYAQNAIDVAEYNAAIAAAEAKAETELIARTALLARLGITEEEAVLLLGGTN